MSVISPAPFTPGPRLIDGSDLNALFGQPVNSVDAGVTALGTTISDAYQLKAAITQLSTVAAATGVKLANLPIGGYQDVYNDGASALTVYSAYGTIDGTAGATGVALANAKRSRFTRMSATAWESAQLGAVSA